MEERIDIATVEGSVYSSDMPLENLLNHNIDGINTSGERTTWCYEDSNVGSFTDHYVTLDMGVSRVITKIQLLDTHVSSSGMDQVDIYIDE